MIEVTFEKVETLTVSRKGISLEREPCSSDLEIRLSEPNGNTRCDIPEACEDIDAEQCGS